MVDTPLNFVFWWFVPSPERILSKTLLHLKNDSQQDFVLIHVLEYVTVILNYWGAPTAYLERILSPPAIEEDPHLVVLCVMDNISA